MNFHEFITMKLYNINLQKKKKITNTDIKREHVLAFIISFKISLPDKADFNKVEG